METLQKYAKIGLIGLILLALGYGLGRYIQPAKIETKIEQVVKEVEVVKKDIVVKERIIKQKDGTEITERTTEDRSTETTDKKSESSSSTVVTNKKPDWRINALGALNKDRDITYGLQVERRILGNISAGVYGMTDKTIGLSVGMEF
jgi:hypothetical protein